MVLHRFGLGVDLHPANPAGTWGLFQVCDGFCKWAGTEEKLDTGTIDCRNAFIELCIHFENIDLSKNRRKKTETNRKKAGTTTM